MAGNIIDSLLGGVASQPGAFLDTFMNTTAKPTQIAPAPPPTPEPEAPPPQKHGTLHDILGYIKDAALVSAGLRPEYQPRKIAEREGAALQGFDSDPIAAIHRLTSINPDKARELYNDMVQNNQRNAAIGSSEASAHAAEVAAAAARQAYESKTFGAAGGLLRVANAKNYGTIRGRVVDYLASRGVEAPLPIPDKYDPEAINAWANGGVETDKQVDNERQERQVDSTIQHQRTTENIGEQGLGLRAKALAEDARHHGAIEDVDRQRVDVAKSNSTSADEYRKWLQTHPSKSRGGGSGGSGLPPMPPRFAGDKVKDKNGNVLTSKDGKTWSK